MGLVEVACRLPLGSELNELESWISHRFDLVVLPEYRNRWPYSRRRSIDTDVNRNVDFGDVGGLNRTMILKTNEGFLATEELARPLFAGRNRMYKMLFSATSNVETLYDKISPGDRSHFFMIVACSR